MWIPYYDLDNSTRATNYYKLPDLPVIFIHQYSYFIKPDHIVHQVSSDLRGRSPHYSGHISGHIMLVPKIGKEQKNLMSCIAIPSQNFACRDNTGVFHQNFTRHNA